jgi:hypothetical protein
MRLMQVMAGGPNGGAEGFFERLAVALARTGIEQRLSIRRDPARYARLVSAGLCASQHRFGGPIDLVTPWQLQREAQMFQPDITLAWMSLKILFLKQTPKVDNFQGAFQTRLTSPHKVDYKQSRHDHWVHSMFQNDGY